MQDKEKKKKILLYALSKTMRELRLGKKQSQFMFASENDIPLSIVSTAERGIKDPQFTTLFRFAEAYGMTLDKFMAKVLKNLPKDFEIIEK